MQEICCPEAASCRLGQRTVLDRRTANDHRWPDRPDWKEFYPSSSETSRLSSSLSARFPLAVVEAKSEYKTAADALQQAKQYAEMLGLKFAYATNGAEIIEFDFTGLEKSVSGYPKPQELWERYRKGRDLKSESAVEQLLTPINFTLKQGERYYQEIAIKG